MPSQTETGPFHSGRDETAAQPASDAPAAPAFGPPAEPGEVGRLGPYRVIKELGRGGMGAVYAALDTRLDRRLALKVMLPQYAADPAARARFLREARAAARVKHDNVVTVYEADERDGVPYIAMEFLKGYPLDEYLRKKGCPTISQVVRITAEAAAGLAAAHNLGLIHRDIKPGNLWLEAPHGRVKVLDFGLARPVDAEAELTQSGAVLGTPAYMSPEQARGEKVDARTDLFSLGVLLYRLCTGKLPFEGPTTMAVLMALGTQEPRPVRELSPSVPESLAALTHQLLAKKADGRPRTAEEVVRRLRAIAGELAGSRARPAEGSLSQAPAGQATVSYAPIQVTVPPPEASPFADIDADVTENEPAPAPKPARKKPGGKAPWMFAGAAALLVAATAVVIIVIKTNDGSKTKIKVPDKATVKTRARADKTVAKVRPGIEPPAEVPDPDRQAAEYVVSLGGFVRVKGLDRDLKAAAELPKERFTLAGVVLHSPKVTDAGLASFEGCKGLTYIHLTGPAVTDAGLAHLMAGKGLWFLDLASTAVTDAGLAHFKDCKGLGHLNLGRTKVTDAGLASFKGCKGLGYLNLGGTAVTDAGLACFKDCKDLTQLILHDMAVTDVGLAYFKDCKGLKGLDLHGTKVTGAGLASFKDSKGLGSLDLGGTTLTDAGLAHLKDCKELWLLNLPSTAVTDAGLAHFKGYKGLGHLNLHGTAVTDAGLAHFKECKGLGYLGLFGTKVTDAGLTSFQDCKGLGYLGLRGTKVTAKALAAFHAAVPGCRIEHDGGTIEPKK
jgi:serine/threonine protein kinase